METLPDVLQDTINLNFHELKFVDTLSVVKQLFDDDVELATKGASAITPTAISISDIESEFSDTSFDIEEYRETIELRQFIDAQCLINNISPGVQTQVLTYNNKILIDLTNDCQYCFDELFGDIKSLPPFYMKKQSLK